MTPCPDCGKPLYPDSIHTCSPQMTTIDNIMALVADNFQATTYGATDALRTAIEQALTPGEPVAWKTEDIELYVREDKFGLYNIPLYTAPQPQREWVGLTDVEWMNIVNKNHAWFGLPPDQVAHEVCKLTEAKLKEKNT